MLNKSQIFNSKILLQIVFYYFPTNWSLDLIEVAGLVSSVSFHEQFESNVNVFLAVLTKHINYGDCECYDAGRNKQAMPCLCDCKLRFQKEPYLKRRVKNAEFTAGGSKQSCRAVSKLTLNHCFIVWNGLLEFRLQYYGCITILFTLVLGFVKSEWLHLFQKRLTV